MLVIVALLAVLGTAAYAVMNERADDAVAARLGDEELTVAELDAILGSLPPAAPQVTNGTIGKTIPGQIIGTWLRVAALREELADRGLASTDQDEANARASVSDPTLDLSSPYGEYAITIVREVEALERISAGDFDPSTVEPPEYICSAHILLDSEQAALDVIALLDDGADFAETAVEYSIGPSGPNGGDLGCAPTANWVPEYTEGARATGQGISEPVQSQFGWHVINVRSFGPLSPGVHPEVSEAEVAAQMDAAIAEARSQAAGPVRQEFEAAAFVRLADSWVNPRYGVWDELSQSVLPTAG